MANHDVDLSSDEWPEFPSHDDDCDCEACDERRGVSVPCEREDFEA